MRHLLVIVFVGLVVFDVFVALVGFVDVVALVALVAGSLLSLLVPRVLHESIPKGEVSFDKRDKSHHARVRDSFLIELPAKHYVSCHVNREARIKSASDIGCVPADIQMGI